MANKICNKEMPRSIKPGTQYDVIVIGAGHTDRERHPVFIDPAAKLKTSWTSITLPHPDSRSQRLSY